MMATKSQNNLNNKLACVMASHRLAEHDDKVGIAVP